MSGLVTELLRCGALALLEAMSGSWNWNHPERNWERGIWEGEEIERSKVYTNWLIRVRCCQVLEDLGDSRWRDFTGAGC